MPNIKKLPNFNILYVQHNEIFFLLFDFYYKNSPLQKHVTSFKIKVNKAVNLLEL